MSVLGRTFDESYPPSIWGGGGGPTPTPAFALVFDGHTIPPPTGPGHVMNDSAAIAGASVLTVNANGVVGLVAWLGALASGGKVRLAASGAAWCEYTLTASPTVVGDVWTLPVTFAALGSDFFDPTTDDPVTLGAAAAPLAARTVEVEAPEVEEEPPDVEVDPGYWTVVEVQSWVTDHPDRAQGVLDAELARGDAARVTLVAWLESRLEAP